MIKAFFRYALALHLGVLCVLVAYQVVARYISFVPPFLWTEEVARLVFIWMVMIGAGYGFVEQAHFSFTYVHSVLPKRLRRHLTTIVYLIVLAVMGFFLWSSLIFFIKGFARTSLVTGMPMAASYGALLFGAGISVIAILINFYRHIFLPVTPDATVTPIEKEA
ncbi:MAG: TRAP transporter small permease [Rhodobacteraceae bacterium]|nr:TRAP transporter small permease [Paracoccaceae bacterium]